MVKLNLNKKRSFLRILLFLAIVVSGVIYVRFTWIRFENEQSKKLLQIARSIEAILPKDGLKMLEAKPSDIDKPAYQDLKNKLKAVIRVNPAARFAYIFIEQEGKIYLLADSEPVESKDYSPPGQEYTEAKAQDRQPFIDGKDLVTAPLSDRWGTWVSVYIPIKDALTGKTIAVFGMDFSAKEWNNFVLFEVIESSALIVLLLVAFFFLIYIKSKNELLSNEISIRKRAQEAFLESEEKYRPMFFNSPQPMWIFDLETLSFLEVNQAAIACYGYSREEFLMMTLKDIRPPEDIPALLKAIEQTVHAYNQAGEWRHLRKNGELMYVEVSSHAMVFNGRSARHILVNDVTKRKIAEQEIHDLNVNLEHKIAVRTAQLAEINARLEEENTARLKISVALQESLERLNNIADNVPGFVYEYRRNPDGSSCFPFASKGIHDIFRLSPEEVVHDASPLFARLHPEDIQGMLASINISGRELTPFQHEFRLRFDDGTIEWLMGNAMPRLEADGSVLWHGFIANISDRKVREQALIMSEKRFSLFMDYLPVLVFIKDSESKLVYANTAMNEALGASKWLGQSASEIFGIEEAARIIEGDRKTLETGYQKIEELFVNLDGTEHRYETQKFAIQIAGRDPMIGGIAIDISERKQAEALLQSKMALLEAEKNATIDGVLVIDENNIRLLINQQMIDIFRIPFAVLEDENDAQLLEYVVGLVRYPDAFLEKVMHLYNHRGETSQDEIELKNGTFLDRYSAPVIGQGDKYYGRIWTFRDVTERKRAEAEIIKARDAANRANLAKSQFLSRMSHELRTPLNSILGFAQLMGMGELKPTDKKRINNIQSSGKLLLSLINEVLELAGIESGKLFLTKEVVSISDILHEISDVVQVLADHRNVRIVLDDVAADHLFVVADKLRLTQVLLNLTNNAIKYNREGGLVTMKTALQPTDAEGIARVRISILDTGNGIKPEDIPKLFQAFERIGAEKTKTEGTGLGLIVVKELVKAMNGDVGVESKVGVGSTFWIELPFTENMENTVLQSIEKATTVAAMALSIADPDVPKEMELPAFGINQAKTGTVLYIEDNVTNTELVEEILLNYRPGIHLVCHTNGAQAVSLAIEHVPDLILLDLDLPDIMGLEVIKLLQAVEKTREIPVVIVSADAMPYQIEKMRKAGSKDYLVKPLDIIAFLEVVDKWVG